MQRLHRPLFRRRRNLCNQSATDYIAEACATSTAALRKCLADTRLDLIVRRTEA